MRFRSVTRPFDWTLKSNKGIIACEVFFLFCTLICTSIIVFLVITDSGLEVIVFVHAKADNKISQNLVCVKY